MFIKELHIAAFGPLCDADFSFEDGLNIIEGNNESGKSAVAMFIKFIFYGLSSRAADGAIADKIRYINWSRGVASGYAVCEITENNDTKTVRIERTLSAKHDADGKIKYSEKLRVLDHTSSMPIHINGQPGEFFFGVPESVFTGSAYASQEGDIRPDSASLKESVENIICAADENINVKRAVDSLDKARIRLLHKNRTGGEILDLERKRDALEQRMEASRETSSRLIKAEISLSDVKNNIENAKARREDLEKASEAIDIFASEAKVKKAEELKKKLESLKAMVASVSKVADEAFMSSLALAVRDIERSEQQRAEVTRLENNLLDKYGSTECDPDSDAEKAVKLKNSSKGLFAFGTVLLIIGLLGILGSAGLKFISSPHFTLALIVTAVSVVLGISVMIASSVVRRRYYSILDFWDVDDEEDLDVICDDIGELCRELDSARITLTAGDNAAIEAEATLKKLASCAGIPHDGLSNNELIKLLARFGAETSQKKKALEAEGSRVEGQLAETLASIGDASHESILTAAEEARKTEIGILVSSMTDEEKNAITRELTFNRTKTDGLRDRELDLERECSALRATAVSPSTDAEELWNTNSEIAKLQRTHDALILANKTLSAAGENIRSSVVPRLTKEASDIIGSITGGKYSSLGISPSFDMNFRDDSHGTLELDYLSAGTKDIAYLALRLALVKALYSAAARPPVIFDESLAFLDESRVGAAVKMLENSGLQTFLFTCRTLEGRFAEKATKTKLS